MLIFFDFFGAFPECLTFSTFHILCLLLRNFCVLSGLQYIINSTLSLKKTMMVTAAMSELVFIIRRNSLHGEHNRWVFLHSRKFFSFFVFVLTVFLVSMLAQQTSDNSRAFGRFHVTSTRTRKLHCVEIEFLCAFNLLFFLERNENVLVRILLFTTR